MTNNSEQLLIEDRTVRVHVKNTSMYNGRAGVLLPNSGEVDDIWDYTVRLDAIAPPEDAKGSTLKLYDERVIGVMSEQIDVIGNNDPLPWVEPKQGWRAPEQMISWLRHEPRPEYDDRKPTSEP